MRLILRLATLLTFLAPAFVLLPDAEACWCGYAAHLGRADVTEPMPNFDYCPVDWSPDLVRHWATWIVRLDAALPAGSSLEAFGSPALMRSTAGSEVEIEWKDLPELFDRIAKVGSDATRAKRARAKTARVYTVQIFASATDAGAARVAKHADEADVGDVGFFFAGDAPATNPVAHVVEEATHGRRLRKVLVGAFLDRHDASDLAREMQRKLGLPTFVRKL